MSPEFEKYVDNMKLVDLHNLNNALYLFLDHPELLHMVSQMDEDELSEANVHCASIGQSKCNINETLNSISLSIGQKVYIDASDAEHEVFEVVGFEEGNMVSLKDELGNPVSADLSLINTNIDESDYEEEDLLPVIEELLTEHSITYNRTTDQEVTKGFDIPAEEQEYNQNFELIKIDEDDQHALICIPKPNVDADLCIHMTREGEPNLIFDNAIVFVYHWKRDLRGFVEYIKNANEMNIITDEDISDLTMCIQYAYAPEMFLQAGNGNHKYYDEIVAHFADVMDKWELFVPLLMTCVDLPSKNKAIEKIEKLNEGNTDSAYLYTIEFLKK